MQVSASRLCQLYWQEEGFFDWTHIFTTRIFKSCDQVASGIKPDGRSQHCESNVKQA